MNHEADTGLVFEILVPIWGERYIRRFTELGLRTLLAPGNLPWLAVHHRVDVTILTTAESLPYFETQPAFRRLVALVDVAYLQIDDLITTYGPNYSAILTRAYNRAMAVSPDMLGRSFIYLVGDLIFSDGALQAVAQAMKEGNDACIMCSPRADAETLEPVLVRRGDAEQLALTGREMVGLLLDHLHPTTVAKTVRDDGVHLSIAHQFFWRPAADVVVSRCFLLHMLCIRPQRRPVDIAAPCDFSYITELAPGGRYHYLTASEPFVSLEVQDPGHEAQFITTYPLPPSEIAERLSYWSTAQHRSFVAATFVFCASDRVYPATDAAELTQPYIDKLSTLLPPPRDHHHHPFWLGSVGAEVLAVGEANLDRSDKLPPMLHRLILEHLAALPRVHSALGILVTDQPGPVDVLLARHAAIAVRISAQRFHDILEDVTGPEGPFLLVAVGDLQDFLRLFRDRSYLQRLLRTIVPGRRVLLSYSIHPDAVREGQPSRGHLRDLIVLRLPVFARFGVAIRIYDLSESPLDGRHGCIIEITAESSAAFASVRSMTPGSAEDAFAGHRGEWIVAAEVRRQAAPPGPTPQPPIPTAQPSASAPPLEFPVPPMLGALAPSPSVPPGSHGLGHLRMLARKLVSTLRS
jgi:hypothetical protein